MKASDLLVKALEAEGVEYIFGIPGEESLDLLESIRCSSIRLILTRHEQAAGFMAATYGRLTGRTGVCLATLGPGATNLVTAAAYAQLGAMPMLMITSQKPMKANKQGAFQIVDVVNMMRPLTKFTRQIPNGHAIPALVREAFRLAGEERPGAVHLELPEDIACEETDAILLPHSEPALPEAGEKTLTAAADMISIAHHPLLMIGAGASRRPVRRELLNFIERSGIPFFSTQMGKGVVDESHPLYMGNAALSDHDFLHRAISSADLVVNVGHDVVEKPPFIMDREAAREAGCEAAVCADRARVIHVNQVTAAVDSVYFPHLELIGDIVRSMERLTEMITPQPHWDFSRFMVIKRHLDAHVLEGADDSRFPIYPQRLVADVRRVMPKDGIVALDNGIYKLWFARNYPAYRPNTVLLDNALAAMGAGLPSAMAARIVHSDRPIVAVCGDGGFMMNAQELETAVRLGLNLVILILRDDAYGMIRWKQEDLGHDDFGLTYGNPDLVCYAECHGARGHRVETAVGLAPLLRHCLESPGVHVIDVPVDYSDNHRILNQEIRERSAGVQ